MNKKTPEIRFEMFEKDWEHMKMGNLLTEVKRPIQMLDELNYQLVTVKRRNNGVVSRGYFKGKDVLVKNYHEVKTGDYLISKRQVVHGANGIVPPSLDGAVVSNEYLISIGNENITTDFLTLISKLPQMYKMFFLSSYGIDIEKLVFNVEDWKKRKIQIPLLEEQITLSKFFNLIDSNIEHNQQALDLLKERKKAFLQKMFPIKGECIPEFRFKGFTGKWHEKKLGDVVNFSRGKGYKKDDVNGKGTPIILYGQLFTTYSDNIDSVISMTDVLINNPVLSNGNEILLPSSSTAVDQAVTASALHIDNVLLASDINVLSTKEGLITNAFGALLINNRYLNDVKSLVQTGTITHLYNKDLKVLKIMLPSIEEQQAIVKFFKTIDNITINQEEKIKSLKQIKKAFLQKMFV